MPKLLSLAICITLAATLLAAPLSGAQAQSAQVLETQVEYSFGGQVTFWARVALPATPEEALVFYRSTGDERTLSGVLTLNGDQVVFVHDLTQKPLRAFAETEYWFAFRFPGGENFISDTYTFLYADNRFQWQQLKNDQVEVNWYEGDLAFGQMALDVAQASLEHARSLVDFPQPGPLKFYIYASGPEMQSTLRLGAMSMVGGHASPDLGVMIVSLPSGPDQRSETERQIPHELMHVLLYQKLGRGYDNLPAWLSEGMASQNEFLPNPDYSVILADAVRRDALLPMASLCDSFPLDAASFFLSYAQSEAFVRYLYDQFGRSGIERLLEKYADGVDCERGAQLALSSPLSELDAQWRQSRFGFSITSPVQAGQPILPWVALAVLVLFVPAVVALGSLVLPGKPKKTVGDTAAGGQG